MLFLMVFPYNESAFVVFNTYARSQTNRGTEGLVAGVDQFHLTQIVPSVETPGGVWSIASPTHDPTFLKRTKSPLG